MLSRNFSIGIDIGGTNTVFGIVNRRGDLLFQAKINTQAFDSPQSLLLEIKALLQPRIDQLGIAAFSGIGIGAPNANFYTGEIVAAANINWEWPVALRSLAAAAFSLPCAITNDAKAAAIGEMTYGAAKGMKDFIILTLGTGVGSGFVANGQLIYGHDGFAGELGHTIAVRDGRACGCGRHGCLERYTSATGIVATAMERLQSLSSVQQAQQQEGSLFRTLQTKNVLTANDIHHAALAGDEVAVATFEDTGKILGYSLADAVAITGPQAIILFGGLAKAGDFIIQPIKKYMEANLLSIYKDKVAILRSLLPENDAAILGASALGWQEV